MGVITLLKDFTFTGDTGQSFNTDWVSFPSEHQNAQLVVLVKSRIGASSLGITLIGTMDTDSVSIIGAVINTGVPGTTQQDIITGLMPMVRLNLLANVNSQVVISVFLTPKST